MIRRSSCQSEKPLGAWAFRFRDCVIGPITAIRKMRQPNDYPPRASDPRSRGSQHAVSGSVVADDGGRAIPAADWTRHRRGPGFVVVDPGPNPWYFDDESGEWTQLKDIED